MRQYVQESLEYIEKYGYKVKGYRVGINMAAETIKVGDILKQAREGYNLTLEQVEQDIKIRVRILDALERGEFGAIVGGMPYIIGHARSYADYLRLDTDTVITTLKENMGGIPKRAPELVFPAPANDSPLPNKRLIWGSVAVVAVIMLGGALLSSWRDGDTIPEVPQTLRQPLTLDTTKPSDENVAQQAAALAPAAAPVSDAAQSMLPAGAIANTVPTPVANAVPEAAPAVEAPPPLVMKAIQDSWMEVRTSDGKIVYSGLLKSGKSLVLREKRNDLLLTTGNAGGIEIYLNGQALPQMGPVGQVRKNVSLDPAQLQTKLN